MYWKSRFSGNNLENSISAPIDGIDKNVQLSSLIRGSSLSNSMINRKTFCFSFTHCQASPTTSSHVTLGSARNVLKLTVAIATD